MEYLQHGCNISAKEGHVFFSFRITLNISDAIIPIVRGHNMNARICEEIDYLVMPWV